ncbi:MAG: hypothetical protein DRP71_14350 [Verrucomicrobia bacterium]|nr:MAG: hypothetical protein DRP71_14350 [Verrucomicrobiota bacterium]
MADQAPLLILLFPLFGAVTISLIGPWKKQLCLPVAIVATIGSLAAALTAFCDVLQVGQVQYFLGGWESPRGIGIELRIDHVNGLVAIVVTAVALITAIYSARRVDDEFEGKVPLFYALFLLSATGLIGMTLAGDAFNLYVLLEVASLTGYALVAMGKERRAAMSAFNYIVMGTIGASFYLLGVGYLYLKTGSLNMGDIHQIIVDQDLRGSKIIQVAFILILIGVWIKMAFFPLHAWLPNVYSFAPSTSACLMAPLVTKVAVYVMIRMMLTVFGPETVFVALPWSEIVIWLAVLDIVVASFMALAQKNLRRMLSYLIIAEVGYMVGGAWLANHYGMVGAIYHIISDSFMTLCMFLAAGILFTKSDALTGFKGMFVRKPATMMAFTLGAFSLIGIPPTCGFFSKFYLIRGGIESGHWEFVIALLFSSLINVVLFFRIIEFAYFHIDEKGSKPDQTEAPAAATPITQVISLWTAAIAVLLIGLFNQPIVGWIQTTLRPLTIVGGQG